MPSLTTSPATPRKDAADRYSPETAAEFTSGEIRRDATRKSDVVRMAATPRTPMSSGMSTTGAPGSATPISRRRSRAPQCGVRCVGRTERHIGCVGRTQCHIGALWSLVVLEALGAAQLPAGQD